MSFASGQVIMHRVRKVFSDVFHRDPADMVIRQAWDMSHNTSSLEEHAVGGVRSTLPVRRKGATRAWPPGAPGLPPALSGRGWASAS
jgi:tRNA-splicing ligase RtcB